MTELGLHHGHHGPTTHFPEPRKVRLLEGFRKAASGQAEAQALCRRSAQTDEAPVSVG